MKRERLPTLSEVARQSFVDQHLHPRPDAFLDEARSVTAHHEQYHDEVLESLLRLACFVIPGDHPGRRLVGGRGRFAVQVLETAPYNLSEGQLASFRAVADELLLIVRARRAAGGPTLLPQLQRALTEGSEALRTCRLMLMGPGRVGKTRWVGHVSG